MKAEMQGLQPKEYEGFPAPPAAAVLPKKRSACPSRSCGAVGLAAVGTAAAVFFLFSQAALQARAGGVGLAAPPPVLSSPFWLKTGETSSSGPEGSSPSATDWPWSAVNVSRMLHWQPCDDGAHDCARLDVPMDWQDPSEDRRVVLAVMRRRATDTADYRGPVFFNPGGPGGSGIHAMRDRGALLHEIVGTNYDLVTWDPRGIGASVPRVDCWGGSTARAQAWALQDPGVLGAHAGVLGAAYARATAYAQTCERAMAGSGLLEHLSTAAHARDLLELLEQTTTTTGEGPTGRGLRYWGFSYGTLLGGTFAALYPDRVERLVSDGNVDYRAWYGTPPNVAFLQDADRVLGAFAWFCHDAGPAGCAFHAPTREGIHDRLDRLLARLRDAPVPVVPVVCGGPELPRLVTWSDVMRLVSAALYQPVLLFPRLAEVLTALEQGDGRPFYALTAPGHNGGVLAPALCDAEAVQPPGMPGVGEDTEDAFPAIMCADMPPINDTVEEFGRFARELEDISHDAGAVNTLFRMACIGRTVRPKWRYDGPFEANTSFPILFINNVVDNVTPAASARNNAAGFPGARILLQNSYGHTSLAAASTCTSEYIHAYFQNGSLPVNGTTCMPESYPFQEIEPQAGNRLSVVTHELAKKRRRASQWL